MKISASYLSIKENLKDNIYELTHCNIDYLHVDVMDGNFVSNKTLQYDELVKALDGNKPYDVHLMVNDVKSYVDKYKDLMPKYLTFHYESNCDIMSLIMYLQELHIGVGLAINPETKVESILPYLPFVDLVLVMGVNPGKGGQNFIPETVDRINKLIDYRDKFQYNYLIEVDGGINIDTIDSINVDIAVVGSYITSGNYQEQIKKIKEKIYG